MVSRGIHPALVDFLRLALAACLAFVTACADIAIAPIPIVTLGGSVATPKGAPVQGVEIYFIPASTAPSLGTLTSARLAPRPPAGTVSPAAGFAEETIPVAKTAFDGTFEIDIAVGRYNLHIYAPERSGVPSSLIRGFEVGRVKPRFDFRYGGLEVTGAVTGPGGDPVTNATVSFYNSDKYFHASARFDGTRYTVYLPGGRYSVRVEPPSFVSGIPDIIVPRFPIAADTTIDFFLTGHLVTGIVTGPDGSPLPNATVYVSGPNVSSGTNADATGQYSLYAPTATYVPYAYPPMTRLDVFSRRFNSVAVAGPTTIDLAFTGITWSGVVREAGTGTPIPGAIVRVVGDDYYGYLGKAQSTTDGTGAFKLYLASPQAYRLTATASGYAPLDPVEASAGSDSTFDLTLNFSSAP